MTSIEKVGVALLTMIIAGGVSRGIINVINGNAVVSPNSSSTSVESNADAKKVFMSKCDTGELTGAKFSQTSYCGCVYDELIALNGNYTQLENDGLNMTPAQKQTKYQPQINDCLSKQGISQ